MTIDVGGGVIILELLWKPPEWLYLIFFSKYLSALKRIHPLSQPSFSSFLPLWSDVGGPSVWQAATVVGQSSLQGWEGKQSAGADYNASQLSSMGVWTLLWVVKLELECAVLLGSSSRLRLPNCWGAGHMAGAEKREVSFLQFSLALFTNKHYTILMVKEKCLNTLVDNVRATAEGVQSKETIYR